MADALGSEPLPNPADEVIHVLHPAPRAVSGLTSPSIHDESPLPENPHPVLVVDDDDAIRWLFARTLEQAGLKTVEAGDGREALELIGQQSFGAVLIDNHMPNLSGLDVIKVLRAQSETSTLPVILITGSSTMNDRVGGLQAGANDYIAKPVDLHELVARVKAQLREQAAWLHVVEGHLRERAAIAHALSQISPAATPELTADVICFELSMVRNLGSVGVLSFPDENLVVPLAQHGPGLPGLEVGRPLPSALSVYLHERARHGPWVERLGRDSELGPTPINQFMNGSRPGDYPTTVALAPMEVEGQLLGLLLLGTDVSRGEPSSNQVAQTLSASIDFARVAAGLLAPGLQARGQAHARRARLDQMLSQELFFPVFQPIVDLDARVTVGYETLSRFEDGARPDLRFAEAARYGVGIELEIATLRKALELAGSLPDGAWLSLNVSPTLVLHGGSLARLIEVSDREIVLELTEHDRIDDYGRIRRALRSLGPNIRVSVDDAGAGFASLRHVLALEPDFVKLDHSWVTGLQGDPARQALIAGLEYFASEAGSQLIAEGVETESDLTTLQKLNVDYGQGYLLGRPSASPVATHG